MKGLTKGHVIAILVVFGVLASLALVWIDCEMRIDFTLGGDKPYLLITKPHGTTVLYDTKREAMHTCLREPFF